MLRLALTIMLCTSLVFADCDFSRDIKKNSDGTYTYTQECHVEVGRQVQQNSLKTQQIDELTKTITMKDLVITKANDRIDLWQNTTFKLEDRVNTIEHMNDSQKILWTIIGAGAMALAVFGAGQLR